MIVDETTSVVRAVTGWLAFYKHESCGKCTPCREGTWWLSDVLHRFEDGHGTESDLDKLIDICSQIAGRSFCALGDAAATPFPAALKYFRDEFVQATNTPANVSFDPVAATVFAGATR
jgi:NADH-quinone oxidoreductase subunit F